MYSPSIIPEINCQEDINEFEKMGSYATLYLNLDENAGQQTQIRARLFGAAKSISGELVFQTGMCGYIEVIKYFEFFF